MRSGGLSRNSRRAYSHVSSPNKGIGYARMERADTHELNRPAVGPRQHNLTSMEELEGGTQDCAHNIWNQGFYLH